jgi:uncharacterized protein (TIGR00369 family)
MVQLELIEQSLKGLFPDTLGIRFVEVLPERVRATLLVRDDLCTVPGMLHGGALMAFADTLGAVATVANLPAGARTTTIESKTNFLAAGRAGTTITGECTPLHRGGRTMVWQTRVTGPDGRLLAVVTQTQAVLEAPKEPAEIMGALFAGKSSAEQERLLAVLERAGAALYRALADQEPSDVRRAELLRAADREEANAVVLEHLDNGARRSS